jgi:ABC-2 type transport system permease protein
LQKKKNNFNENSIELKKITPIIIYMTNKAIPYKLTFVQQLLGRHYKWLYLIRYQIKHNTAYRTSTLIWMFGRLLILSSTIFIWWINIQAGSNLIDFNNIFTYYIFGSIISIGNGVHWNIAGSIRNGGLSTKLLRPSNFMSQVIISDFGWWIFPSFVEILLLLCVVVLGSKFIIYSSIINIILYIGMGIIGYFISVFISYILGSIAFFIIDVGGVLEIQNQISFIFSGKAMPLSIIGFLQPLTFLPFAFSFHHPMQIYLGKYSTIETFYVFAGGIIWTVFLYLIAKWIFYIGLKKNEAVGL